MGELLACLVEANKISQTLDIHDEEDKRGISLYGTREYKAGEPGGIVGNHGGKSNSNPYSYTKINRII
jgi:hypothetical protein